MSKRKSDFRKSAALVYKQMQVIFLSPDRDDSLWPQGNAIDSVLDYLMLTEHEDAELLTHVCNYFNEQDNGRYDDLIWPGAAAAKAFDPRYHKVFNSLVHNFRELAIRNWKMVVDGVPGSDVIGDGTQNVWNRIQHTPKLTQFKPRFSGGSWQSDITIKNNPGSNWDGCESSQLSVINGLMLMFSGMLHKLDGVPHTISKQAEEAFKKQVSFLHDWISPLLPVDENLLRYNNPSFLGMPQEGVLIRERVSTYAINHQKKYPPTQLYNPNRVWTGDSGLVLRGLGYCNQDSKIDPIERRDISTGLVNGVQKKLYGLSHYQSEEVYYLNSTYEKYWTAPCCDQCYQTGGPGIFLRGMLNRLLMHDDVLTYEVKNKPDWQKMIANLAHTATKNYPYGIIDPNLNLNGAIPLFPLMDCLAALTLAIYVEEHLGINLSASI